MLFTSVEAHAIVKTGDHLHVSGSGGFEQDCEMVLVAVGVKPNTQLACGSGRSKPGQKARCWSIDEWRLRFQAFMRRVTAWKPGTVCSIGTRIFLWALLRTNKGDVLERTQSAATVSLLARWERRL